jgi:fucose permease
MFVTASYIDNLRGPLLPVLSRELGILYDKSSLLVVMGSFGAFCVGCAMTRFVRIFSITGARYLVAFCVLMTLALAFLVHSTATLALFAIFAGATINALGTTANLLILFAASHANRVRAYSALHIMYGLGSALGPTLVGTLVARELNWRLLFFPPVLILLPLFVLRAPINLVSDPEATKEHPHSLRTLRLITVVTFLVYVLAEVLTSTWMVVFLVESRGLTLSNASPILSGFFITMALSRFFCSFLIETWEKQVLVTSLLAFGASLYVGITWSPVVLMGCGLAGPFFPIFMGRLTRAFGPLAQRIILDLYLLFPLTLGSAHLLFGQLTNIMSMHSIFSYGCGAFVLLLFPCLGLYFRVEKSLQIKHEFSNQPDNIDETMPAR